jgi:Na+-transporting NADH:ubiquinone oxidoreductase subunit C
VVDAVRFRGAGEDGNTIAGLGFYEHGETPGLGGEVDNPRWKAQWPGKQAYRDGDVEIALPRAPRPRQRRREVARRRPLRGHADQPRRDQPDHFWLGENGYGPFIDNLRKRGSLTCPTQR